MHTYYFLCKLLNFITHLLINPVFGYRLNGKTQIYMLFLPPATNLGQGYIFTGVCDSVHSGGGGVPAPGGAWSGGMPGPGGACSRGGAWETPPGRLLLRAVRILLECILVCRFMIDGKCAFLRASTHC